MCCVLKIKKDQEIEFKKVFDSESKNYALFKNNGEMFIANFERKQILTQLLNKSLSFKTVLEVGCGWGRYLSFLSSCSTTPVGVDLSKQMLILCKKRFPNRNIALVQGEMSHLPFKDDVFDLVYSVRAFKYSSRPRRVLAEIYRISKIKGLVSIYEVNNSNSFAYLLHSSKRLFLNKTPWTLMSTLFSMKTHFRSVGFSKVSANGVLFVPPRLYLAGKSKKLFQILAVFERIASGIPYFNKLGYGIIYNAIKTHDAFSTPKQLSQITH